MSDENADVKIAVEEMRWQMEHVLNAADALDAKVNIILVVAGLAIGLATTMQISLTPDKSNLYWVVLILTILLYSIAVWLGVSLAMPKAYQMAISREWEEIDAQLLNRSERDALLSLLSGYTTQITRNEAINAEKSKLFKASLICLAIVVVLLFVLIIIQYIG